MLLSIILGQMFFVNLHGVSKVCFSGHSAEEKGESYQGYNNF